MVSSFGRIGEVLVEQCPKVDSIRGIAVFGGGMCTSDFHPNFAVDQYGHEPRGNWDHFCAVL
eukprot:10364354-Heterocapsa_arctica.AAC.1